MVAVSTGCQLDFSISNFVVQKLSSHVRHKWEKANSDGGAVEERTLSSEDIYQRLRAAEANRMAAQQSLKGRARAHKRPGESQEESRQRRAQKLEEKLAFAEFKRQNSLEEKRMKATAMLSRTYQVAERMNERQSERAAQLDAKLKQAERMRESQLAAAAARWGGHAARAKEVSAATRAREEAAANKRRLDLDLRLQRAGDMRHELTETVISSLATRGAEPFLVRHALTRSILRRQSSSRVLQRCWRSFVRKRLTTSVLAERFAATGIPTCSIPAKVGRESTGNSPQRAPGTGRMSKEELVNPANARSESPGGSPIKPRNRECRPPAPVALVGVTTCLMNRPPRQQGAQDAFEKFARALQSPKTLQAAAVLLRRLVQKLGTRAQVGSAGVEPLLRRLFPKATAPDRFQSRVFLCAFMILKHPQVVFNQKGEREDALSAAAADMVAAFEALLQRLLEPLPLTPRGSWSNSSSPRDACDMDMQPETKQSSVAELLVAFDAAWLPYLEQFAAWKLTDAASLEAELVRIAVEMEASMLSKLGSAGSTSPRLQSSADLQAVVEQVQRDHVLLRERIQRLGGTSGIKRLEAGLAAARAASSQSSSPVATPTPSPGGSLHSSPSKAPATPTQAANAIPPASPTTPPGAAVADGGVTNESLAWALLYDLNFQLPTADAEAIWSDATGETCVMEEPVPTLEGLSPAQAAVVTSRRVRRIADQAFWDSVAGAAPGQIAGLLSELAGQLLASLPDGGARAAAPVREQLSHERLQEALAGAPNSAASLLQPLELLATALRQMGSPARDAPAIAAHARIRAELASAAAGGGNTARPLIQALRLLAAQLRLLQVDMGNAQLHILSRSLAGGEGIRYAQQKFAAAHSLSDDMQLATLCTQLPHTRAWLALASGQLPLLADLPISNGVQPAAQQMSAPQVLRTGRSSPAQPAAGSERQAQPAATLVATVARGSWRGLVRIGLVGLAVTESQVGSLPPPLAETLEMDAERINAAKAAFQQVLVLSASMLLVQQAAAGRLSSQGRHPTAANVKQRLTAMLADESLGLPNLAAEIARLAAQREATAEEEEAMAVALKHMLTRGSTGYRMLSGGLTKVLLQLLLDGHMPLPALAAALGRFGAGALTGEVSDVAQQLKAVAAVSEAVHGGLYERMAADLL